jgi:hypothetical protein
MSVDNDQANNDNVIKFPPNFPAESLPKRKRGEFFTFDRRCFAEACKLGLNAAVVYLVVCRGAGSRAKSSWSIDSIERYTGIGRFRAKKTIKALIDDAGLLTLERDGTRPQYGIVPYDSWISARLSDDEKRVRGLFSDGLPTKINRRDELIARRLCDLGFLKDHGRGSFSKVDLGERQEIWLPNAIIEGAEDEVPPIALLRQMQDIRKLKLFAGLYDCQDLPTAGGVNHTLLYQEHTISKVSQRGSLTIWSFGGAESTYTNGSILREPFVAGLTAEPRKAAMEEFWEALKVFQVCGLITFIPHIFESNKPDALILHAYPVTDLGCEPWEREVSAAAHVAGMACIPPGQQEWAAQLGRHLLPLHSSLTDPSVIGIARLRYRPRTKMTGAWFAISRERAAEFLDEYQQTTEKNKDAGQALAKPAT